MTVEHDITGDKPAVIITDNGRTITARQAAEIIGITIHAVRKRLKKIAAHGTKSITITSLKARRLADGPPRRSDV